MKTSQITILLLIIFSSCTYRPFPKEKYEIGESFRNLFKPYRINDTLIFKNSQNIIDSFIISGIDSGINDRNGYFINARNTKSISVRYRQIPVDKWQYKWFEGTGTGKDIEHSEDGTLISIVKFPDNEKTEYYFDFKEFRCSKSELPKLNKDTIKVDNLKISDYYKIESCAVSVSYPNAIKICYSTIDKGLIAFITNNNTIWTRQN